MTFALLVGAFVVGMVGLLTDSSAVDFHLMVETMAVLAGITGVYAERRAAAVERRHAAVAAVHNELEDNVELLTSDRRFDPLTGHQPKPRRYPRLDVAATVACLAQNALTDDGDAARAEALGRWRKQAEEFNRGLNLTELLFYLKSSDAADIMVNVDQQLQTRRREMEAETQRVLGLL